MSRRRTHRANHIGLALVGLLLIAAGAATLARAFGLFGPAQASVISGQVARYASTHPWFWPAVAIAAIVIELLALRWLVLQARTSTIRYLDIEPDPRYGATRLGAGAAAGALEDELAGGPYGERVHAAFTGEPSAPGLSVKMTVPDDADPAEVNRHVSQEVTRLRQALESERLPATIRIHAVRSRS